MPVAEATIANAISLANADVVPPEADASPVAEAAPASATQAVEDAALDTPEQTEAKARAARLEFFQEKLVGQREKRQAQRLAERAKAERKAANADREAAKAERAKYEGLKEGSYKDTLTALGRDPAAVYAEMQREAIEASTPEGIARKAAAQLDERLAAQQARIDALERERSETVARSAAQQHEHLLVSHFTKAVEAPEFANLRDEYPSDALLDHARHYDKHPQELQAHAQQFGVRLTDPSGRFSMHELLQVLSAAQAAHEAAAQARRAARAPVEAEAGKLPTVNGTAERRNAAPVTNDLASARASSGPKINSGSVKERLARSVAEEIKKSYG